MTPTEALALIQSHPLTLSTGQPLQDWLARETTLGPAQAPIAIREYQRFLALALCAAPGEITVPGPRVAQIWRIHRDNGLAHATFLAALDAPRLAHHSHRTAPDPAPTLRRYAKAFGPPDPVWWPPRRVWSILPRSNLVGTLIALPFILGGLLWLKDNQLDGVIIPALLLYATFIVSAPLRRALTATDFRIFGPTPTSFAQNPKASP